jgi:hypothetical protein
MRYRKADPANVAFPGKVGKFAGPTRRYEDAVLVSDRIRFQFVIPPDRDDAVETARQRWLA